MTPKRPNQKSDDLKAGLPRTPDVVGGILVDGIKENKEDLISGQRRDIANLEDAPKTEKTPEKRIAGLDLLREPIAKNQNLSINLGLDYYGQADFLPYSSFGRNIAVMELLTGLEVKHADRSKIQPWLVPSVKKDKKGYFIVEEIDKYAYERERGWKPKKVYFEDILEPQTLSWGSYPKFRQEQLANFMAAVEHADLPMEVKRDFFNRLIQVENFKGTFEKYRPPYEGGSYDVEKEGKKLKLPTGESMRLVIDTDFRTSWEYKGQDNFKNIEKKDINTSDVLFILKAVELGKLPQNALDIFYGAYFYKGENEIRLVQIYPKFKKIQLDFSQPFTLETEDFSPLYLSLVLRDPRMNEAGKAKLKAYLQTQVNFECADKTLQ